MPPELINATDPNSETKRLAMLLWSDAGVGKTSLAATARGNKLWILFDDGGLDSVQGLRSELVETKPALDTALKNVIHKLDYTKEDKVAYVSRFETSNDPLNIEQYLTNVDLNIQTVVVDSLTTLGDDAIEFAVKYKGFKSSTMTKPGLEAYGARLTLMKMFVQNMLKLTAKHNKDIIFISHAKDKYDQDELVEISLALGGSLANDLGIKFGEIWYMRDSSTKGREIFFVPFQKYKPMKTRMFDKSEGKPTSFKWKYDISNPDISMEIATWFKQWEDSGYKKIEVPK